ncbi:MAG: hypothetical protein ACOYT4_05155 [Nanoarchaeota archaeon]
MEKDIGKIRKNDNTDIIVRIDDFGGRVGVTIREYTTSGKYTGFTKSGTRISSESFEEFKKLINSIDMKDLPELEEEEPAEQKPSNSKYKKSKVSDEDYL